MGLGNKLSLPWWRSKYILWSFLCLPGLMFTIGLFNGRMNYEKLMHATGEFSGRFLMFSLIATPLVMLLPKFKFPKWLARNRRYFGVAAFGYGVYHLIAYLVEVPSSQVMAEFFQFGLLTGWIAFFIWVPMTITSTDGWVRSLKQTWKKIHNWGYLAALLAYLHWAFIHDHYAPALVHALPVVLLQLYRWIKVSQKS